MQTLTLKIKDDFMAEFMSMIDSVKDKVIVQKDQDIELDPYFYERQKKLQKIRDEIKDGKVKMIDDEVFWEDMDTYVKTLQK
jgi:hypothetical protein